MTLLKSKAKESSYSILQNMKHYNNKAIKYETIKSIKSIAE